MTPRELVDYILSGPSELVLDESLRFRRRTRSNPCDFNEFLQALQSSKTLQDVSCFSQDALDIREDEWVLLMKALGRIRHIQIFRFDFEPGSRNFHPFQAVADAVSSAPSLRKLVIGLCSDSLPIDTSGLSALACALREHTALEQIRLIDSWSYRSEAAQGTGIDPVLRALPASACSHLRTVSITSTCASAGAMKNLLQLGPDTILDLVVNTELWLAVADGIRQGHCNIKHLSLDRLHGSSSKYTETITAIASAIRLDHNLEHLTLTIIDDFTDGAGVALGEALTVNKNLCTFTLLEGTGTLGAETYEAFSAMLRVNTSLLLLLPAFKTAGADERLVDSREQIEIEQRLNLIGRGKLLSSKRTTREEWVDSLDALRCCIQNNNETPELTVGCLYSLLRLNPSLCLLV